MPDLPLASPPPSAPRLPAGSAAALDMLAESLVEARAKAGYSAPRNADAMILRGADGKGSFDIELPAEGKAPVGIKLRWWAARKHWVPQCSCNDFRAFRTCAHLAPAALALRRLVPAASGEAATKPVHSPFAEDVAARADRKLTPAEWKRLDDLTKCHQKYLAQGRLNDWDLGRAGWMPFHATFPESALPVNVPLSEADFWLCVSAECRRQNIPLPDFMGPITAATQPGPAVVEFFSARERRAWADSLDRLSPSGEDDAPAARAEYRLRLVPGAAQFECRTSAEDSFQSPPDDTVRRWLAGSASACPLPADGALALRMLQRDVFVARSKLSWSSASDLEHFARIIAQPTLRPFITDFDGDPVVFHTEPLAWRLREPQATDPAYTFELATAEGEPFTQAIQATLPGPDTFYLCSDGIRPGPADLPKRQGHVVRVPAAVMESAVGLRLARRAGVEAPPSVTQRVRVEAMPVVVEVRLGRELKRRTVEWVQLEAFTTTAAGKRVERLGKDAWIPLAAAGVAGPESDFVLPDRRLAEAVLRWVAQSAFSRDAFSGQFRQLVGSATFAADFHAWLKQAPPGVTLNLEGELLSLLTGEIKVELKVEVQPDSESDWFGLKLRSEWTSHDLSPQEIELLRAASGRWVRLPGKGWRRLEVNADAATLEALARIGLDPADADGTAVRAHALQLAGGPTHLLPAETAEAVRRRAGEIKLRVAPPTPKGLKAELRPYQTDGFHFLSYLTENRFGGVLADDMGLGKTVQTIAWLVHLREAAKGKPKPILVICPKSVMENWRAECERFAPGLKARVWRASEGSDFVPMAKEADLHIINYAHLRLIEGRWPKAPFLAVVADEAQAVKNPDSDSHRALCAVPAVNRLALTGTPIENRLLDLWAILAFSMPGLLGPRSAFQRRFGAKADPHARLRLAARVRPFLLRRTKAQVATDLPERIEEDLVCELEGNQRTLYDAEVKRARAILLKLGTPRELDSARFNILASLTRLRQICCDSRLVLPEETQEGAKIEALREQLETLLDEGQKVLVFSQFTSFLDLVDTALAAAFPDIPRFRLDGSTENRGELVADFQAKEGAAVFLLSLKAGGTGLNLTGASYVILCDPWWNPAVENQAIDRTHRIGQTQKVIAYRLVARDTVEEKIRTLQAGKKALAEDVLGEERFAQSLDMDDFKFLLDG